MEFETQKTNDILKNCNFIKTVLMISVVLAHSCLFWGGDWFSCLPLEEKLVLLPHFGKWMCSYNIYCFVLISGYIFYYIKQEQRGYKTFKEFLLKKTKRLLVPYFFVTLVWCIPIACFFRNYTIKEFIFLYILGTSGEQLWFLLMLFWVFMFFYFIANFVDKHPIIGGGIALLFYMVGLVVGKFVPDFYRIWTGFKYMPFFYLGFMFRKIGVKVLDKVPSLVYILFDIILYVANYYLSGAGVDGAVYKVLRVCLEFVLNTAGAVMAFIVLQRLAKRINWNNKFFLFISDKSMAVYLFHQQIIYFVLYFFNNAISPYAHASLNFIISFCISLIISSILMLWNPTRFLIGEKAIKKEEKKDNKDNSET